MRTHGHGLPPRIAGALLAVCAGLAAMHNALGAPGDVPRRAPAAAPDLVLLNGDVFTGNPAQPHAQALAIRGERIVAVGTSSEIAALAGAQTRRIDLDGHLVVPGINDAHEHLGFVPAGDTEVQGDSPYDPGWASLRAAIAGAVAKAPRGGFIEASIGGKVFYDPAIDRSALDAVAPQRPVLLSTFDGHAAILNSAALAALGIGEDVGDPLGGRFERDAHGRLTGVAREFAADQVWRAQGRQVADADAVAQLRKQLQARAMLGITTTQTMPVVTDAARFVRLLRLASTPIRVRVTPFNTTTAAGRDPEAIAGLASHPAPLITVSGTKWVLDGVLLEGSLTPRDQAAGGVEEPQGAYSPTGLPALFDERELEAILRESLRDGRQLQVHVFGYPAARAMLDAMDATGGAQVWASRRVRFEHGDGLLADLLPRVKALGVIVSQQPSHLDLPDIDPRFAERVRAAKAQPLRALLDAGIPLALGSDGPVTSPWANMMFAITHPSRPEQAITREQALAAYTLGSAYAEFAEQEKGSLQSGKLADLAVLSQDIFKIETEQLPATRSLLTLVGGRVAYAAAGFGVPSQQP